MQFPLPSDFQQQELDNLMKQYDKQKSNLKNDSLFSQGLNIDINIEEANKWLFKSFFSDKQMSDNIMTQISLYFSCIQNMHNSFLVFSCKEITSSIKIDQLFESVIINDFNQVNPYFIENLISYPKLYNTITFLIRADKKWYMSILYQSQSKGQIFNFSSNEKQINVKISELLVKILKQNYNIDIQNFKWEFFSKQIQKIDCSDAVITILLKYFSNRTQELKDNNIIDISNISIKDDEITKNRKIIEWICLKLRQNPQLERLEALEMYIDIEQAPNRQQDIIKPQSIKQIIDVENNLSQLSKPNEIIQDQEQDQIENNPLQLQKSNVKNEENNPSNLQKSKLSNVTIQDLDQLNLSISNQQRLNNSINKCNQQIQNQIEMNNERKIDELINNKQKIYIQKDKLDNYSKYQQKKYDFNENKQDFQTSSQKNSRIDYSLLGLQLSQKQIASSIQSSLKQNTPIQPQISQQQITPLPEISELQYQNKILHHNVQKLIIEQQDMKIKVFQNEEYTKNLQQQLEYYNQKYSKNQVSQQNKMINQNNNQIQTFKRNNFDYDTYNNYMHDIQIQNKDHYKTNQAIISNKKISYTSHVSTSQNQESIDDIMKRYTKKQNQDDIKLINTPNLYYFN